MITKLDLEECERIMSEDPNRSDDDQFKALLAAAGLPGVKITTEDRLRGAITTAILEVESGRFIAAHQTLQEALHLSTQSDLA
jgi:hypothetical protein